jgi:hypothetical protein
VTVDIRGNHKSTGGGGSGNSDPHFDTWTGQQFGHHGENAISSSLVVLGGHDKHSLFTMDGLEVHTPSADVD